MGTVEKLEQAVSDLSIEELRQFAVWFAAFHADFWDRQIEQDALDGRLDNAADVALAHHRAGRTRPL